MDNLITFELIKNEFEQALKECGDRIPVDKWVHRPIGVELTAHKTKYGMATPEGMTLVSEFFIGTRAINKLCQTIRHELAHLAVGLKQQHNYKFKRCASFFGAMDSVDDSEVSQILDNIGFKWSLVAHMLDGSTKVLGGVHRKTKRYTEYPDNGLRLSIAGIDVVRFDFQAI